MSVAPKSRPRTKPAEERRAEIMNAAERLFLKRGVGPTTIEQITSGAGVAKGTFYLYFSSKEDVLGALEGRFAQEHLRKIKAGVAERKKEDWRGKLAAWASAGVSSYLDSIGLHDMLFYGWRPTTRKGLVNNIVINHLVEMLQAGADAGAWTIGDARFTGVFLFNGLHGAVDDAVAKEMRVNRSRLARRVERLFFRAAGLRRLN